MIEVEYLDAKNNVQTFKYRTLAIATERIQFAVTTGPLCVKSITDTISGETYSCVWSVYLQED